VAGSDSKAHVLVVDDERDVADVYALRLGDRYETSTAYSGEAALDQLTAESDIDVVLLDRHMPAMSGDHVLAEIKEQSLDCRVVMLTAVNPDFEIIEMPFDDYICKPAQKSDLLGAIEQQLAAKSYDETLQTYLEATSKVSVLEGEKSPEEFAASEAVADLEARLEAIQAEMDDSLAEFTEIDAAFKEIDRHPGA
jgi:CheY-like chemotaxis protein